MVSLQKGQGELRGERKEKRVRFAKNKIKIRADSKESSPRVSPNVRGTESVGKIDTR
jgi:hypothetical protein